MSGFELMKSDHNNVLSIGNGYEGLDIRGSLTLGGILHHHHDHDHGCEKFDSLAKNNPVSLSDEEDHSFSGDGMDGNYKGGDIRKISAAMGWQRVKWVDSMVKLLITAVSYLSEEALLGGGGCRKKVLSLHKKGKWKLVSRVMAERGFLVSPQQCEDKFNDLNKRYKKLNDILGRGTSCQVVEKPALLDMMDHLPEKTKDEVRKILSSSHLFYEEMCSYHNNNRLHLPHDPHLQRSLQLALNTTHDYIHATSSRMHPLELDDAYEDDHDHDVETDDHEEYDEIYGRDSFKRIKLGNGFQDFKFVNPHSVQDIRRGLHSENTQTDINLGFSAGYKGCESRELEERRLKIEMETLELEKERFKWQRLSKKKDGELEMLKIQNERMKLENERCALELKRMEMMILINYNR